MLKIATTAYQISSDGIRKEVPSKVTVSGGGNDDDTEFVEFSVELPLDPSGRSVEASQYLDRLLKKSTSQLSDSDRKRMLASISEDISQHRTGNFHIECKMLDGAQVYGIGGFDLEVLFKGRFSDHDGLPGYWESPRAVPKT